MIYLNCKSCVFLFCIFSVIVAKLANIDVMAQFVCLLVAAFYSGWYCYDSYKQYMMSNPGELRDNFMMLWNDRMKKKFEKMEKQK